MKNKTALVLGGSGLVGGFLLQQLLEADYTKIIAVLRKPLPYEHEKLSCIITDFNDLNEVQITETVDVLFSCLGTTKAKTPDLKAYQKIEVGIPKYYLDMLLPLGLKQVHLISAIGVKGNSKNFYLNIKHQAEQAMTQSEAAAVYLYRPSLIVGKRDEKRFMENVGITLFQLINPLLLGKAKRYKSIRANKIASSMIQHAQQAEPGRHIIYFGH